MKDRLATLQKENNEMKAKQVDMEYDLQRATKQFEKLIKKLNETHESTTKPGGTPIALGVPNQTGPVKLIKDTVSVDVKLDVNFAGITF